MTWDRLLDERRIRDLLDGQSSQKPQGDSRSEFERDRDRTIFSSPVRRLIGKTQVFPLDPNDHVRTRLVHSLEVSTVAEGLASQAVRDVIAKKEELSVDQERAISKIAETCGLLHDLGNPPFGHAGELAIASWFKTKVGIDSFFLKLDGRDSQRSKDFLSFEGNAQTLRIATNTHLIGHDRGLNLTCATTAAARKYLASSLTALKNGGDHAYSKPGYFQSEEAILDRVAEQTGTHGRRHPITFLVEAADDIVYSVVNIEDGIKKLVLDWAYVDGKLKESCGDSLLFQRTIDGMNDQLGPGDHPATERAQAFRINAISQMVRAAVLCFGLRYEAIMCGEYREELVYDTSCQASSLVNACKTLLLDTVFRDEDVLRLEVRGRRVLHELMDLFWEGVRDHIDDSTVGTNTYARELYQLIAGGYRTQFEKRMAEAPVDAEYLGLQLVTDFVSGMTDGYACRLHSDLTNG